MFRKTSMREEIMRACAASLFATAFGLLAAAWGLETPENFEDFGSRELAGNLEPVIINVGTPYLVAADIIVPPGETVEIEEGTIFAFKPFTGLLVHGTLIAKGNALNPIIFTSENDVAAPAGSAAAPAPYDWNGITIFEHAEGTVLQHCTISYSLFGLNTGTDQVVIRQCYFYENGKSDLVLKGKASYVGQQHYSNALGTAEPEPANAKEIPRDALPDTKPATPRYKLIMRIAGGAIALAGLGAGIYQTREYAAYDDRLKTLSEPTDAHKRDPAIIDKWDSAKRKRNTEAALMAVGYGGAALGCGIFTFTLFIK
jgi:hypothetical protein